MIAALDLVQRVLRDSRQLRRSIAAEQLSSQWPWGVRATSTYSSKVSWPDAERRSYPGILFCRLMPVVVPRASC
jgi:hypothetical protein